MNGRRMPGKRWKGGVEGWERDIALCVSRLREPSTNEPRVVGKEIERIWHEKSFARGKFSMGVYEWWQGNEGVARELWAESASATEALLDRWLPTRAQEHYTVYVEPAENGAIAASLAGQTELARKLFSQAELLASALRDNDIHPPWHHTAALDRPDVRRPYVRAYCLLRLGRLSGFNGYIYTVPLAEARNATPLWRSIDIHETLDTANLCFDLWRRERHGLDSLKKKKFEPLLRALAACLSPGAGEPERLAARKALRAYQDSIHDLQLFFEIYPRVLDLQTAYPHLFG